MWVMNALLLLGSPVLDGVDRAVDAGPDSVAICYAGPTPPPRPARGYAWDHDRQRYIARDADTVPDSAVQIEFSVWDRGRIRRLDYDAGGKPEWVEVSHIVMSTRWKGQYAMKGGGPQRIVIRADHRWETGPITITGTSAFSGFCHLGPWSRGRQPH
jgi:hypothetical protein